jgi:hypothetical protein
VPDILVSGGSSMDGLAGSLMAYLADIRKRAQSTGPEWDEARGETRETVDGEGA